MENGKVILEITNALREGTKRILGVTKEILSVTKEILARTKWKKGEYMCEERAPPVNRGSD